MKLKCPRCGNFVETGATPAGGAVTCSCGNVLTVPKKAGMPWWVILLILGAACVPCTGILAAIAIPNFIRFQARAKQSECKTLLRSLYTGARMAQEEGLTTDLDKLGFMTEANHRYSYFTTFEDPKGGRIPTGANANRAVDAETARRAAQRAGVVPGIEGECPDCSLTAICAADLDGDETLDIWSVSTADRTGSLNEPVPAGEVYQHSDDIRE